MEAIVYSRGAVERVAPHEVPHIIVSITTTADDLARLPENEHTLGVLRLVFGDCDPSTAFDRSRLFTRAQAHEIWRFVDAHRDAVRLVVHCDAGLSRSPAVAAAITRATGGDESRIFEDYRPNMHVYRTLIETREAKPRRATPEDIEGIRLVAAQSWRETYRDIYDEPFIERFLERAYSHDALAASIARDEIFLVVQFGYTVGAFAHWGDRGNGWELFRIYARPVDFRSGVGRALIEAGEALLRERGATKYFCMVQESNARGRSFYEALGFVRTPSGDDGDHLRYERSL